MSDVKQQQKLIPNPLWCEKCSGRGYLVGDADWEPYAVQCDACADRADAMSSPELYDADPNCKHEIVELWSGVKCRNCRGWFCY